MKVAFVVHEMTGGGAERVISVISNYMVKKGIDVSILMTAGGQIEYELDSRVKTKQIGTRTEGNPLNFVKRIVGLRKKFKVENYDAIVAFEADTGLYAVIANMFLRNKLFISERNDPDRYKHKLLRFFAYNCADRVIFQTDDAKDYFSGRIRNRGVVIGNPLKEDIPDAYLGENSKRIVAVGRLEDQKNYPMLLEAFEQFYKIHSDYTLHIYGKGYLLDYLREMMSDYSSSKAVIFEGFSDDVINDIRDAAMFVMTSDYEGMPNALMEAMAVGLPVISTDCPIGGPRQLISDGKNGLLVSCGEAQILADAMDRLADDPVFAKKLGNKALKIRDKYNAEVICAQWIKAIS